jgi:hypothetical protein
MTLALYFAAFLLVAVGIAHSYLGERYILRRLFRRNNLPEIFGSTEFTTRTLRFAWHVTSVAWLGFAAILVVLANPPVDPSTLGLIIGSTFFVHFAVALIGSRGRHLSWPVFLAVGVIAIVATCT